MIVLARPFVARVVALRQEAGKDLLEMLNTMRGRAMPFVARQGWADLPGDAVCHMT